MSVYAVNKVCRRLVHEPELREALASEATAEAALRAATPPLSDAEVAALWRATSAPSRAPASTTSS